MENIRRLCVMMALLVVNSGLLCADIIKLKDGTWVTGKVIAETDDIIMIQAEEGVKKIYRKDIQEITKGDHLGGEAETTRGRFRINDIGKIPLSDLESDVNIWLQKLEPLHRRQTKRLAEAQKGARLDKMGAVYVWLSKWCKQGFLSIGVDNLDGVTVTLGQCETKLGNDIDQLSRRGLCRSCKGSGFKNCSKCGDRGVIEQYKKTTVTNLKTSYTKTKRITVKCPSCKGKGKEPCVYDGSRWKLCHEPEKRVKKIGGLDKLVEIEAAVKRHRSALSAIKNKIRQGDAGHLRKLAERCHQERYYYMTLEILRRIERKKNGG